MIDFSKNFSYNKIVKIKDENFVMKLKELKKLAKEIVTLEQIIDTNEDEKAVNKAKNRIIEISGHLDPEDMMRIDELVQEQMQNQS